MLSEINDSFGYTDLTLNDVDFYYGGLRPLVEDRGEAKSTYNTSRKTEILDHKESGFPVFLPRWEASTPQAVAWEKR
ncbi:hypothetical protein LEP1GSC161_2536 [Leptospira santarosai str. CBC1416]|uniref:Uncharacterized protein n=1 Tax=Leptospira santarosai str. CBC1416 TaxID=1193059 RepID=M6VMP7_9LEPT|nr:hypothetical protein LEP1GSC161_2536 [Leptospira santarosai str. CBC1416]